MRAGLGCAVVLPAGKIAAGKLAQAIVHGATLVAVDGNFDDCLRIVRELAETYPVALVNSVNPYRLQGQKTAAFEVVDALGDAPDIHVLPVGNAGNISAYWMGYNEYAGRTTAASIDDIATRLPAVATRTPQMWGVQAEGAAPFVKGAPVENPETVATAIRIGNPASWAYAVAARDDSGGRIDAVTDAQILDAQALLAAEVGVFVEPASAASVAGLLQAAELGQVPAGARIVCTVTGNGLKDTATALGETRVEPHVIAPTLEAAVAALSPVVPGAGRMRLVRDLVRVRVPATSANLGPGFDALGLALGVWDEVSVRAVAGETTVRVTGEGAGELPDDEAHLVVRALRAGLEHAGAPQAGLELVCHNAIPHGRGMGSSAAAVVAGLVAARGLVSEPEALDDDAVLALATQIEGHPDNAAPALFGGATAAWVDADGPHAAAIPLDDAFTPTVLVPVDQLLTHTARAVLPGEVPHRDAAFNVARTALLVLALGGRRDLLMAGHPGPAAPALPRRRDAGDRRGGARAAGGGLARRRLRGGAERARPRPPRRPHRPGADEPRLAGAAPGDRAHRGVPVLRAEPGRRRRPCLSTDGAPTWDPGRATSPVPAPPEGKETWRTVAAKNLTICAAADNMEAHRLPADVFRAPGCVYHVVVQTEHCREPPHEAIVLRAGAAPDTPSLLAGPRRRPPA